MDVDYEPRLMELRTVFGLELQQRRNDAVVDNKLFTNVVTNRNHVNSCHCSHIDFFEFPGKMF